MLQILSMAVSQCLEGLLGKYYYPAGVSRPAFKLDQGQQSYVSPDRVEGLEVVVKPLGMVGIGGLLLGARLRYQADITLIQHDINLTSDEATEVLAQGLIGQEVKVIDVVPIRRQIGLDSLDQTRIRVEYYQTIRDRSKLNGNFS